MGLPGSHLEIGMKYFVYKETVIKEFLFIQLMKGLVLLYFFPFTYSFGFQIHILIGKLLESFISPITLQNLHKCHYPTDFSNFSTWADKMKRVPKYSWTRTLHYYDIDNNPPEFCPLLKYPDDTQPKYNLIQFIHGVLEKNTSCISIFDFKLLIHLLQDFFQPLHLTGKERGGNSEFFYFQDKKISLHSFWDTKLFDTHYKDPSGVLLHFSNLVSHKLKNDKCSLVDLPYIISLGNSLSQINCDIIWKYNDIDYLEKSLKTLDKLIVDSVFHSLCILDSLKNEDEPEDEDEHGVVWFIVLVVFCVCGVAYSAYKRHQHVFL